MLYENKPLAPEMCFPPFFFYYFIEVNGKESLDLPKTLIPLLLTGLNFLLFSYLNIVL